MFRNFILLAALLGVTCGCSCLFRPPQEVFCDSDWVGVFEITAKTPNPSSMKLVYTARAVIVFKAKNGIPQQGKSVKITTTNQSAACGVDWLLVGKQYLLSGGYDKGMIMNLCGQIQAIEWSSVNPDIKNALLKGTYEPCPCTTVGGAASAVTAPSS